jgi:hypothetical protein
MTPYQIQTMFTAEETKNGLGKKHRGAASSLIWKDLGTAPKSKIRKGGPCRISNQV